MAAPRSSAGVPGGGWPWDSWTEAFELEQRGTTPVRELLAGVTTFMALSYIVSLALVLRYIFLM